MKKPSSKCRGRFTAPIADLSASLLMKYWKNTYASLAKLSMPP